MMQEQVIATEVKITSAGQIRHFQIRLPKDTDRVIGIEHGIGMISRLNYLEPRADLGEANGLGGLFQSFQRSLLMGELKLQSCGEGNIFYSQDVQTDGYLDQGAFSNINKWIPSGYSHQGKTEEDVVMVKGDSTIINGMYRDRAGELYRADLEYLLHVYVWVKIKSEEKGEMQ